MKNDLKTVDMLNGNLYKSIIVFALPLMASGFLQLLFNAADLVVVGKFCGSSMVGAVGAATPFYMLLVNLFLGFSLGVGVTVSTGIGENNKEKITRTVHTSIPLALICGTAVAVAGCLLARPMLVRLNTPADIIDYSVLYIRIAFVGMPGNLIYNYSAAIVKADGDTRRPLRYLTISGVLNVILNVIFVTVFDLNVAGVALATAITTVLSAFLTVRRLTKLEDNCRLELKKMHLYKAECLKIMKIGLPAGIQNAMFSVSNLIIQKAVNSFGTAVVSGSSAAQSINGFQYVMLNGVSQAAVNFTGQNYGAQNFDRLKKVKNISLLYTMIVGIVTASLIYGFSEPLLSIYIDDSLEAVAAGKLKLFYVCIFAFLNGLIDTISSCMRGIGSSSVPAAISIIGICGVRLLIIFTIFRIPAYHTLNVLYFAYPASWVVSLIADFIAYRIISKKKFPHPQKA